LAGAPRRVGVEIEVAGRSPGAVAELLCGLRGGRVVQLDSYRFQVKGTDLGNVTVELDLRFAHPPSGVTAGPRVWLARTIGLVASPLAQVELIFPPLPPARLPELDRLVAELIGRTRGLRVDGPHLNPDIAAVTPAYVVAHLRAFIRLAPRLRVEMGVRPPGRTGFVTDFPQAYRDLVTDPAYRPDQERLIDDYLAANPTRYRELDLLPLLMFLAPERVRARVRLQKINPRPVFHWRMPATRPFAGIVADWNRWVTVERLAAAPEDAAAPAQGS
jgi:hypothetical protein